MRGADQRLPGGSAALALLAAVILGSAGSARGQENGEGDREQPRPASIFDFLDHEVRDPYDLHPPAEKFQNRWRPIWGALGMRYHLYPAQQTGREDWPPRLYAGGVNYSIWRHPVTGWPEF